MSLSVSILKKAAILAAATWLALGLLGTGEQAHGQVPKLKIIDKEIEVKVKDAQKGDIRVAKGDTVDHDLSTQGGSITVDGLVDGDCAAFGGTVTVNGEVQGDVASFGGSAIVNDSATVEGDIASFGGTVTVNGTAGKDIVAFGGNVVLGPRAVVEGDIATMGGQVEKSDSAQVKGEITKLDLGMLNNYLPKAAQTACVAERNPILGRMARVGFILGMVIVIGILAMALTVFFPKTVEGMAREIQADFWKSAGVGLIIQFCIPIALFILLISILGIPLIPIALLILFGVSLIGTAAVGLVVIERLYSTQRWNLPPMVARVALGCVALGLLALLGSLIGLGGGPFSFFGGLFIFINVLLAWCVWTVGMGSAFVTRLGSRKGTVPAATYPLMAAAEDKKEEPKENPPA